MTFPYEEASSVSEAQDANAVDAVAGACPPKVLVYRIYPEYDFTTLFGQPPTTVKLTVT